MGTSLITVTALSTGAASISPSGYSSGIYDGGSVKFKSSYEGLDTLTVHLSNSKTTSFLAKMEVPDGDTVRLTSGFANYTPLAGKYIAFRIREDTSYFYVPIIETPRACGDPSNVKVEKTLSAGPVDLTWGAGSSTTNNSVTGYDVQRCESSDGSTWGDWETVSGSPTSSTKLSVEPPETVGNYYQFRVRTRGSAGSSYYSRWITSTNTLQKIHVALEGFSESPLTPGMAVKALHMAELHDRVNTLREAYGLSTYEFSPIDERGIAGWTDHVNEIRDAIDDFCTETGGTHEAWLDIPVNCPRADIIEQLRAVVLAL